MKKISFCLFATLLLFACEPGRNPAQEKLLNEITALEKQLLKAEDASKDKESALLLIEKTAQYAQQYPQDTLTPTLLFRAGDVAKRAKEYGKAMELWGQVGRDYSKHHRGSMALFLQGFTFDSDLHDPVMASKYYKKFLTTYPNDTLLATQVKQLLAVINVKPEDLIRKYETE
ncbi:MAG: hypothetical protein IPM82_05145 [Saprospiraceae bacterium]|nr:hypothetical protein [Saprospiraceae bacterium]